MGESGVFCFEHLVKTVAEVHMQRVKYLIIGAGISGLSFAFHKKHDDYLIIEKDSVCGGLARSFYKDGFVWDIAGHFFHFHSNDTKTHYDALMYGKTIRTVEKSRRLRSKFSVMVSARMSNS